MPFGHARSWPIARPRRGIAAFMHKEVFDLKKLRRDANILPWPKNRAKTPAICLFRDLIIAKACYRDPLIDSTTQGSVRKFSGIVAQTD